MEAKPARRNPPPPFTTSTLQQEASRKLGFSPAHTMRLAQRLYEGIDIGGETVGLITYMRTDGIDMAPEAIAAIRGMIGKRLRQAIRSRCAAHLSEQIEERAGSARSRCARPIPTARRSEVASSVDRDQARLYELIWNRAVASQMQSAELERTTVDVAAKVDGRQIELRATGQVVKFDGFLTLYQEGQDEDSEDDESRRLPAMSEGETLDQAGDLRRRSISPSRRRAIRKPRW